jgi:hypothetical protein
MILLLSTLLSFAHAHSPLNAPPDFDFKNSKAVFVDMDKAQYDITYDIANQKASYKATITFEQANEGHPIFDIMDAPTSLKVDGADATSDLVNSPDGETAFRVVNSKLSAGKHELIIEGKLSALVTFEAGQVRSAFWTSDLRDRGYLEQYLPTNMEYDQVQMNLDLKFVGAVKAQKIYTNGVVKEVAKNHFTVEYPEYFTASSIFFHTAPAGAMNEKIFTVKSVDGRDIPAIVYLAANSMGTMNTLETLEARVKAIIAELEADYGAFPHPSITVYNAGMGGMEYCGATMTSTSALGHELTHSYFARGVIPANGNAGWMDEAIASWRDDGYPTRSSLSGRSTMAGHGVYTRQTDRAAYSFGADFMAYVDGKFKTQGGLKSLLRHMVEDHLFKPITTANFVEVMNTHFQTNMQADFDRYIYGKSTELENKARVRHPFHQKMSQEQLKNLL